jgi:hypothetical protein
MNYKVQVSNYAEIEGKLIAHAVVYFAEAATSSDVIHFGHRQSVTLPLTASRGEMIVGLEDAVARVKDGFEPITAAKEAGYDISTADLDKMQQVELPDLYDTVEEAVSASKE